MSAVTTIRDDILMLSVMKMVSDAFTEASSLKIRDIRKIFDANRQFYDEISYVYHLVKANAILAKKYVPNAPKKIEKVVSVALTANQHFYGNVNFNIITAFAKETMKAPTDRIIIGKAGINYIKSLGYDKPYDELIFPREFPTTSDTMKFLAKVKEYDRVIVYYTKFLSVLKQTVSIADITQSPEREITGAEVEVHILFEPEFSLILKFFEQQIRSLLFLRILLESDLARTASRLLSTSSASERTQELIHEKETQLRRAKLSLLNRELLVTFAGMKHWKKNV